MLAWIFWLCIFFILYVYVGYPLLLAVFVRLKARSQPSQLDHTPTVTVLIAAHNEEKTLPTKLDNSLKLDYPAEKLQIVVAADGSEDGTEAVVKQYAEQGVELSYFPNRLGKTAAINRAMAIATGEIVVFSDANNLYRSSALRELIRPFGDERVGGVTGAKKIITGDDVLASTESAYWKYESFIKKKETQLGSCVGAVGEIFAIRRKLFEPPPDDIINDDLYMALRLIKRGYRLVYAPRAVSSEYVSPSAQDERNRRSRIVTGRLQIMAKIQLPSKEPLLAWKIISHKYLRPFVVFAMLGAFLANVVLVLLTQDYPLLQRAFYRALLALQILFYCLAWLGSHVQEDSLASRFLYTPTFLLNSNLAALVGFYGYFSGRQTSRWQRSARRSPLPPERQSKE